jgi:dTDP-4-amino-4,6-dideoxygalactose transaminase
LDADNRARKVFAEYYDDLFHGLGDQVGLPPSPPGAVYHQYALTTERRDAVCKALREAGVGTNVHYPVPLHKHKAFADAAVRGADEHFPIAEQLARSVLSLPIQPELRMHELRITKAIQHLWVGA